MNGSQPKQYAAHFLREISLLRYLLHRWSRKQSTRAHAVLRGSGSEVAQQHSSTPCVQFVPQYHFEPSEEGERGIGGIDADTSEKSEWHSIGFIYKTRGRGLSIVTWCHGRVWIHSSSPVRSPGRAGSRVEPRWIDGWHALPDIYHTW